MPLSEEARHRFASFVDQTDPSSTDPDDDAALLHFVAWGLVHQPDALHEWFALESIMSQRSVTDSKMRYVLIILRAAEPLVAAYERERDLMTETGRETPPTAGPHDPARLEPQTGAWRPWGGPVDR